MTGKIVCELPPELARQLLHLIHNTEIVVEDLQNGEDFKFDSFVTSQSMNLEGIESLTYFLESIFGKSQRRYKQEWDKIGK